MCGVTGFESKLRRIGSCEDAVCELLQAEKERQEGEEKLNVSCCGLRMLRVSRCGLREETSRSWTWAVTGCKTRPWELIGSKEDAEGEPLRAEREGQEGEGKVNVSRYKL